jgi:hypothetical protein
MTLFLFMVLVFCTQENSDNSDNSALSSSSHLGVSGKLQSQGLFFLVWFCFDFTALLYSGWEWIHLKDMHYTCLSFLSVFRQCAASMVTYIYMWHIYICDPGGCAPEAITLPPVTVSQIFSCDEQFKKWHCHSVRLFVHASVCPLIAKLSPSFKFSLRLS